MTMRAVEKSATSHAILRMAQRGIRQEVLDLLSCFGVDEPAGAGCVRRRLRRDQIQGLLSEGFSLAIVERAVRTEAVYSRDERLITCYWRSVKCIMHSECDETHLSLTSARIGVA